VALSVEQCEELILDFCSIFPATTHIRFNVKNTQEELDDIDFNENDAGAILGTFIPERLQADFVASHFSDTKQFQEVLRHEILGHFGFTTFGADEQAALRTAIVEARDQPGISDLWQLADRLYHDQSEDYRAEEIFAFTCEGYLPEKQIDLVLAGKAYREVCVERVRPMGLWDLRHIVCTVAQGMRDQAIAPQEYPMVEHDAFRKGDYMETEKKPFHETVAEKLIEQLREGTAPWQKPWQPGEAGAFMPINPTTGKRYRGINALQLMSEGRTDQRWMTYKQACAVDAQVRKGEKGTPIQYWKFTDEQTKLVDGKPVLDNRGDPVKETVKLERPRVFFATVFNAEQIDGLPPLAPRKEQGWNASDRAEQILLASGAAIRHGEHDRAFYRLATDNIHLPDKAQFPTADAYYAVALHELGHWTGHPSRLDRDLVHPFGSEGYAKEELRAEIASMILGDELGIGHDPEQHAAYVGSWIKALQDDPLEIFRAAADAEKIQDYVLGLEQTQVQEQASTLAGTIEHPQAFIDTQGRLRDWTTADPMPLDWQGVIKNEGAYWYVGQEAGERSFTVLAATTFQDALSESQRVEALTVDIGTVLNNPDVSFSHFEAYQGKDLEDALRSRGLTTIGNVTGSEPARFFERAEDRLSAVFGVEPGRTGADNAYLERKGLAQEFAITAERLVEQLQLQLESEEPMNTAAQFSNAQEFPGFALRVYDAEIGGDRDIAHSSLESAIDAFVVMNETFIVSDQVVPRVVHGNRVVLQLDQRPGTTGQLLFDNKNVHALYERALHKAATDIQSAMASRRSPSAQEVDEETVRTSRAETWTLARMENGTLPRALDHANLAQLNRVQGVLAAMAPVNRENAFWQRHPLPADSQAFELELYEAGQQVSVRQTDAHVAAARLALVTGQAFGHVRAGDIENFGREAAAAFDFTLPQDWNGAVVVQGVVAEEVDGKLAPKSALEKGVEPEFWGVYAQRRDGTKEWLTHRPTEQDADRLAERLALVDAHSTISEQAKVAKLARVHEMRVRRDPNSTDEQISAAKEARKNAELAATAGELQQKAEYNDHARAAAAALPAAAGSAADDSAGRALIDVPFKEKNQAKELGAKWDRQQQSWYIPAGVDAAPFAKWAHGGTKTAVSDAQAPAATAAKAAQVSGAEGRFYLAVPYTDRAAASVAGAKWDKVAKSWYAGPNADMAKLEKWKLENVPVEQTPAMPPKAEFAEALKSIGCVLSGEHPIMDGTKHRISVEGEKFSKNSGSGFYVGHLDGYPAGYMKNNKTGVELTWKAKGYTLDPEQKAQLAAEAAQKLQQREADQSKLQDQAAKRVATQLRKLQPAKQATPYMLAKGIEPQAGALTDKEGKKTYIPAIDSTGKQWTMQYIQANGTKRFAKDSRKEGCFHIVGGSLDDLAKVPAIVIGEGYATSANLKQSLGFPTVSAFDSGNLPLVAQALHQKFPDKPIVIAGDDDRHLELTLGVNPGRTKAEEAAALVGGKALLPIFAPGEASYPAGLHPVTPEAYREHQSTGNTLSAEQIVALEKMKQYTDFNDLATRSALGQAGLDRQVRSLVDAATGKHQGAQVGQGQEQEQEEHQVQEQVHTKVQALQQDKPKRQRKVAKVA
jgi:putative DNA primase/helicase